MVAQGEIYMANLSPTLGHEQSGRRPVLVIQKNLLNRFLTTIIIIPITSRPYPADMLTVYFLPKAKANLKSDSYALLYQIRTTDRLRLERKLGSISEEDLKIIKERLGLLF